MRHPILKAKAKIAGVPLVWDRPPKLLSAEVAYVLAEHMFTEGMVYAGRALCDHAAAMRTRYEVTQSGRDALADPTEDADS